MITKTLILLLIVSAFSQSGYAADQKLDKVLLCVGKNQARFVSSLDDPSIGEAVLDDKMNQPKDQFGETQRVDQFSIMMLSGFAPNSTVNANNVPVGEIRDDGSEGIVIANGIYEFNLKKVDGTSITFGAVLFDVRTVSTCIVKAQELTTILAQ